MGCGTAILIACMVTGVNSYYHAVAILLLGVPAEALQKEKPKNEV